MPRAARTLPHRFGLTYREVVDDGSLRASDAEREEAVAALRHHLLAGRLSLDEFCERVEAALRARFRHDLARANADLPDISSALAGSLRKPTRLTGAMFGHVVRRGPLKLHGRTIAFSGFGDLDFDLRTAMIAVPRATVTVLAAFGNADVYVPEGLNVDVSGMTIFGHLHDWGRARSIADAPAVRIRVRGFVATVDVWRVPHGMRGSYSEVFRQLSELHRQLP